MAVWRFGGLLYGSVEPRIGQSMRSFNEKSHRYLNRWLDAHCDDLSVRR